MTKKLYKFSQPALYGLLIILVAGFFVTVAKQTFATHCFGSVTACHSTSSGPAEPNPGPTPTPYGPNTDFITECGPNQVNLGNSGRAATARPNCAECPPNTYRVTAGDQEACLPRGQTLTISCEPAGYTFVAVRSASGPCCSRRAIPLPRTTVGNFGDLYHEPLGGASETWMCTSGGGLDNYEPGDNGSSTPTATPASGTTGNPTPTPVNGSTGAVPTPYGPNSNFISQCGSNQINSGNSGRGANAVANCVTCPPNTFRVVAGDQEACLPAGQTLTLSCEPEGYTFVTTKSLGSVCCSRRAIPLPGTTIGDFGSLYLDPLGGASETWKCVGADLPGSHATSGSAGGTTNPTPTPIPTGDRFVCQPDGYRFNASDGSESVICCSRVATPSDQLNMRTCRSTTVINPITTPTPIPTPTPVPTRVTCGSGTCAPDHLCQTSNTTGSPVCSAQPCQYGVNPSDTRYCNPAPTPTPLSAGPTGNITTLNNSRCVSATGEAVVCEVATPNAQSLDNGALVYLWHSLLTKDKDTGIANTSRCKSGHASLLDAGPFPVSGYGLYQCTQ